jgi:hypothetical protein
MLEKCAPGYTWRMATHSRVVKYQNGVYRSLPKHDQIEIVHTKKMVRHLGIDRECVSEYISI